MVKVLCGTIIYRMYNLSSSIKAGPVNVPEKCVMYLAPARGATTCHAQHGPKCSGTPCRCQDDSQTDCSFPTLGSWCYLVHAISTRECAFPLECLLPRVHRGHLFQFRLRWDIDEYGFIAGHRIGDGRNQLPWIGDSHSAYTKCLSNANGVHFVGEIDAKIAFAVVQPGKCPTKVAGFALQHEHLPSHVSTGTHVP